MRLALATAAALLVVSTAGAATAPQLTVFAAASLTEVFPGSTQTSGTASVAPTSSRSRSDRVRRRTCSRLRAPSSRRGSTARVSSKSRARSRPTSSCSSSRDRTPPVSRGVFDLRRKNVKLVIGTARVPIGAYTRDVLRRLGMTSVLQKVVSEEPDVKSIVGKVALGQADAGFVYATDVRPVADRARAIAIPAWAQPKVRYEIAVVSKSANRAAARAWVARLTQARARRLLHNAGFGIR